MDGPPLKQRRLPVVPVFAAAGTGELPPGEEERRRKAGLPVHPIGSSASSASSTSSASATAAASASSSSTASAVPASARNPAVSSVASTPARGVPVPTPRAPDCEGSTQASCAPSSNPPASTGGEAGKPLTPPAVAGGAQSGAPSGARGEADGSAAEGDGGAGGAGGASASAGSGAAAQRSSASARDPRGGLYGFEATRKEAPGKAIALRLEPLKDGLPEFERVLSESRQSITVGSQRGTADVLVRDEAVSKKHVVLSLIGMNGELALCIVDFSTNGTFVNGKRVPAKLKRFRVRSGDTLLVKDPELEADFGWKLDFGNTVAFFSR